MGKTLLFCTFVVNPEASPKSWRISKVIPMSLAEGRKQITTSSAYREMRCCKACLASDCNKTSSDAFLHIKHMTSMINMKSIGDSGSPWRSPRRCNIVSPGLPLSSTCVEAEASNPLMISHQIGPKPMCLITSNKKGQVLWWAASTSAASGAVAKRPSDDRRLHGDHGQSGFSSSSLGSQICIC